MGNNNAITNGSYVYIDDLKLVGSDYDFSGEYEEKPAIEPDKYEKGEKLLDATSFDAMVKNVFEADCGWAKMESADETPVVYGEYTFFRGSAENPEKFDKAGSTYQSLGHTENAENRRRKRLIRTTGNSITASTTRSFTLSKRARTYSSALKSPKPWTAGSRAR